LLSSSSGRLGKSGSLVTTLTPNNKYRKKAVAPEALLDDPSAVVAMDALEVGQLALQDGDDNGIAAIPDDDMLEADVVGEPVAAMEENIAEQELNIEQGNVPAGPALVDPRLTFDTWHKSCVESLDALAAADVQVTEFFRGNVPGSLGGGIHFNNLSLVYVPSHTRFIHWTDKGNRKGQIAMLDAESRVKALCYLFCVGGASVYRRIIVADWLKQKSKPFQQEIVNASSPQRIISFGDDGRYLVLPNCDVAMVRFKG